MLKDLEFDEIQEYFEQLNEKPASKFLKAQLYGMAKNYSEILQKENLITDQFTDNRWEFVKEVFIVNDDYQIVKVERKDNKEILYHIFVNYKKVNECVESFDKALIAAISYKYTNTTLPASYYAKMIDMKYQVEKSE